MTRWKYILSSLAMLVACARDYDPCPPGSMKSTEADRCIVTDNAQRDAEIPDSDAHTPDASQGLPEASIPPGGPDASMDSGRPADGGRDASVGPTPETEAGVDASASRDASTADASTPLDASTLDAGEDASVPSVCSSDDVEAWRALHLSDRLTTSIGECFAADPSCLTGSCPLDVCLRQKAGVVACETCVQDETECVASQCGEACGSSGGDAECRACACAKGCVGAFDSCAATQLNVCADCNETTCIGMSMLAPELIMALLHPVLMGMRP